MTRSLRRLDGRLAARPAAAWPAAGLLLLLLLLLAWARPAAAHAAFLRSDPAPNSVLPAHVHQVTIWFTEPLEPSFSEIHVFDSAGQRVDAGDSAVHEDDPTAMSVSLPTLPDGTYTVAWRNVSTVDGHALRGSFVISFGEPLAGAGPAEAEQGVRDLSPLEPLARALVLVGALAVVGGLGFEHLILRPVFFPAGAAPEVEAVGRRLVRRSRRLVWLALVLLALASALQLLVQTATVADLAPAAVRWPDVTRVLQTTDWGSLWLVRLWLLVVAAGGLSAVALLHLPGDDPRREDVGVRVGRAAALLATLGVLLTLSLTSHAAAMAELRAAALFSDVLHLLAAAFWIGGLFHFALGARPVYQALPPDQRRAVLADLVPRFSTLALLSVGVLIITGLYSSWAQVTTPAALVTPYGLTLLAKLALFAPMLALGAFNLLWIGRRLRRGEEAGRWLRRAVSAEALLGLLILLSVGLLTSLEPARQVADRLRLGQEETLAFQETVERTEIALTVEPALAGANHFVVELRDPQGRPIANATEVSLELTYLDAELGRTEVIAQPEEPGRYVAEDVLLSVAGEWQVALLVLRPDAFDAPAAFRFEIRPASGVDVATRAGVVLWGIELALLGVLFLSVARLAGPSGWRRPPRALAWAGVALAAIGVLLAIGGPLYLQAQEQRLRNPIPPTAASLATGETLYGENCLPCHGASGLGDGPLADDLEAPPADLVEHVPLHPDAELYTIIRDGMRETPMPSFERRLSEEEMWHLVNYLRTLPDEAAE